MSVSELYRNSVTQALAGFQLVEEMLKSYLEMHFDAVRRLLDGRLYFEFHRKDYQDSALGRLVNVFSKVCSNEQLLRDLRSAVRDRDHLAHKALLKLYEVPKPADSDYVELLEEVSRMMHVPTKLMDGIVKEMERLRDAQSGA